MTCFKFKRLAKFFRDRRGVTAVEFGFIALPFFSILVAVFEIGIIYLAQNVLETATEDAARQLLTGQVQKTGMTKSQFVSSLCSRLPAFFTCSGIMVDLQDVAQFASANTSPPTLTYNTQGQVTNQFAFNAGGAGSILVLRVFYQFPIVPGLLGLNLANLSNGTRLMMASSVFQVEPYASNGN